MADVVALRRNLNEHLKIVFFNCLDKVREEFAHIQTVNKNLTYYGSNQHLHNLRDLLRYFLQLMTTHINLLRLPIRETSNGNIFIHDIHIVLTELSPVNEYRDIFYLTVVCHNHVDCSEPFEYTQQDVEETPNVVPNVQFLIKELYAETDFSLTLYHTRVPKAVKPEDLEIEPVYLHEQFPNDGIYGRNLNYEGHNLVFKRLSILRVSIVLDTYYEDMDTSELELAEEGVRARIGNLKYLHERLPPQQMRSRGL